MKFIIIRATSEDIKQLYELQLIAFESEAQMIGNRSVPALMETIEQAQKDFIKWQVLKAVDTTGKIIGSVRFRIKNNTVDIGRLMVHPEYRGNGLGRTLLYEVEKYAPDSEYELFTCTKSISNIRLYERLGYKAFKEEKGSDGLDFVYMKKSSENILRHISNSANS